MKTYRVLQTILTFNAPRHLTTAICGQVLDKVGVYVRLEPVVPLRRRHS